jgi:RNA polymerase sigma factor (sigma-70 family)
MNTTLKTPQDLVDIFDMYYKDIYTFVFFKTYRNKEISEDITQDVFMKAWEKRDSFKKHKSSIRTWLYVIAKNTVIDYYRKQKFQAQVDDEVLNEFNDVGSNYRELEVNVLKDFVIKQFDNLEETEKDLLVMRYVQQLELEEIATIIQKQYNATKVAVHRAIKKLQSIINHE